MPDKQGIPDGVIGAIRLTMVNVPMVPFGEPGQSLFRDMLTHSHPLELAWMLHCIAEEFERRGYPLGSKN